MKYLSEDGLLYLWSKIKLLLSKKVDTSPGMGLSHNDFTDDEKSKLNGLNNYTLPVATSENLGGVKIGTGLDISNGVLSTSAIDWSGIANKPDIALKSDLTSVYRYKGSVSTYSALPSSELTVGDVYNVEDTGMNWAWTGSGWDSLGEIFNIQSVTNQDIDDIVNEGAE